MSGAGHEIKGKKPVRQFGSGFLKGRSDTRINMGPATVTGVSAPFVESMKFGHSLTIGTGELGSAILNMHDLFQAGAVVWKFGLELLKGIFHGRYLLMNKR
jgi:hypothetical protein